MASTRGTHQEANKAEATTTTATTRSRSRISSWMASTESSRPRREDRRDRYIRGSTSREEKDDDNKNCSRQRGRRIRGLLRDHPYSRSRSRGRRDKHTTRGRARDQKSRYRSHREGDKRTWITPRNDRGDSRGRFYDSRSRSRDGRNPSRDKRGLNTLYNANVTS